MQSLEHRWAGWGIGLMVFLCLSGCHAQAWQREAQRPTTPDSSAKKAVNVERGETEDSAQLLVRDFLQDGEDVEFGYFVYLIFAEQSRVTYNKRLAAASPRRRS